MPLEYKLGGIANESKVCFEEFREEIKMRALTRQLIFHTERIGVPVITKDNAIDFWKRVNAWERTNGCVLYGPDTELKPEGRFITLAEVSDHIGLRTNARRLSETKFYKEILAVIVGQVDDRLELEKEKCIVLSTSTATPPSQ